jgi:hypothetical protein
LQSPKDALKEKLMTFFARMIRILIWIVVISWGFRLLRQVVSSLLRSGQSRTPLEPAHDLKTTQGAHLVRDPVCGVHIAEVLAIPLRENGDLLHFCSIACRDRYLNTSQKLAANG